MDAKLKNGTLFPSCHSEVPFDRVASKIFKKRYGKPIKTYKTK